MALLHSYPYLGWCLLMLAASGLAAAVCLRRQRLPMLLSGVLTVPVGTFAFLLVPDYWDPAHVFRWFAGLEDTLFGLANGMIVWTLASRAAGRRLEVRPRPARMVQRYLVLIPGGLLLYLGLAKLGMRPMDAALLVILTAGLVLLVLQPGLRRIVLPTALCFGLAYALLVLVAAWLWPQFPEQWNHSRLWGLTFGDIPLEEFVWALAFGATWPLIVAYVLDARSVGVESRAITLPRLRLTWTRAERQGIETTVEGARHTRSESPRRLEAP